jgi:hypothetical protein
MSTVIDVKNVNVKSRRIFLDANVWILIQGFSANSSQWRVDSYSAGYKSLIQNENKIVLNDYVLGEFFNRCAQIEFNIETSDLQKRPSFKKFRDSGALDERLETIRDTCLNMLDECEFVPVGGGHYRIDDIINRCVTDCIDFSDLVLIDFCKKENLIIMTDDADYADCGLSVITANRKMA